MKNPEFLPNATYIRYPETEMIARAEAYYQHMARRRTVRQYTSEPVPRQVIEDCLRTAGTAPSGANMQPWKFVVITDPALKRRIRLAAETEEHEFYQGRATPEWLEALAPLGTDEHKPFLDTAPYLIAIFVEKNGLLPDGRPVKHYYALESVGIATGMLIAALHNAGLATLTHTPSPMNFLNRMLDRPDNERPFLLLVAGYPAPDATVPDIRRKTLEQTTIFI